MKKSDVENINLRDKKVVISGYYGFDNFGDEAILGVLANKLCSHNADVTVISRNPEKTSRLYCVKSIFSFALLKIIFALKSCDVLISGGGSLLQDVTSIKSLLYYLWIINTALFFKKKVIIFAQGIGPIHSPIGRLLTKMTLKKCSLVTVRDEKSLFWLRGWGIKTDLVCDPLFDLKLVNSFPSNRIGVQLRGFKTLKEKMLVKLAEQINKTFPDKEIEIYSFQDSLDMHVCEHFQNLLKTLNPQIKTKLIYNQTSSEVLDKISKLDYMIAMRFHANLVALMYGVKSLAICYDEKVEKLAIEAQIPYMSMRGDENYEELFSELQNLNTKKLVEFSNSKHFDWEMIEKVIE